MTVPLAADQARSRKTGKTPTESDLATAKPGRDPNQPIDEEYTKKIKRGAGGADDPDIVQGRPATEGSNLSPLPPPQRVQPWQYALPTDEQLKRNPATLIPPQLRPRVALRFDAQNSLLVSGLLDGGGDIAQRPVAHGDDAIGKGKGQPGGIGFAG